MSKEDDSDRIFKALADRRRRAILDALKDHPRTTGALCAMFPEINRCTVMQHIRVLDEAGLSTVMQHIRVLDEAGLIIVRREGRERWNHLNAMPIKNIHDRWIADYARSAVSLLARLKSDLEA